VKRPLQAAVREAFRRVQQLGFNALEVAKINGRNWLGVKHVRLIVYPRQVRRNPYVRDLDPHSQLDRVWDFKRVHRAIARNVQQMKAI